MKLSHSGHALPREEGRECDDAWAVQQRRGATMAALADGVGASQSGGAAARRAVDMLCDYCLSRPRAWSPRRALVEFTAQANRHLHSESVAIQGSPELACTLAAVLLESGRLFGCNVGDSAIFLYRDGQLKRLSQPHTLGQPGMDHVLTQALGLGAEVEPHFVELDLAAGDQVLLCSDGVTCAVPEESLARLLRQHAGARSVVTAAREASAQNEELRDDASAIVLEIADPGPRLEAGSQSLVVRPALRPGDSAAGHRLVRPLARGNDRVWLAEDTQGTRVVLKFPPADAAETETLRDAFVREAWNASRLASPDLVRAWTPDGPELECYAMEFVDAQTLRAVLRFGRLGVEDACRLAQFFLRAEQFLLREDLVHGDLKPDNVLVLREPEGVSYRLLDLGCAATLFSITSRAGTPSYLAPERFRGGAISEATEIFAIGVTLYEALTGAYPYGEIERFQTPRFEAGPRRVTRLNPAVPAWLEAVIERAIDPDPERRFQHFSEMSYALANPGTVAPHYRKDASLLERNPLRFYKVLSLVLFVVAALLALRLATT